MYQRNIRAALRNPIFITFGLFNPLCFLFLFAPVLSSVAHIPGFPPGGALAVFVPGLLVMVALYACSFVGFGLIDDLRSGLLERLSVTPLCRSSILFGMVLADVTMLIFQSTLLLALAYAVLGLRISLLGALASLALICLIGAGVASFSYSIALMVRNEDALAPLINFFLVPLQLLSGITLPLTLAPLWLQWAAYCNPLSHAVNAARQLCAGVFDSSIIVGGFVAVALLTFGLCALGVRTFQKFRA